MIDIDVVDYLLLDYVSNYKMDIESFRGLFFMLDHKLTVSELAEHLNRLFISGMLSLSAYQYIETLKCRYSKPLKIKCNFLKDQYFIESIKLVFHGVSYKDNYKIIPRYLRAYLDYKNKNMEIVSVAGMTNIGGLMWEQFFKPDWSLYYNYHSEEIESRFFLATIEAGSINTLNKALEYHYYKEGGFSKVIVKSIYNWNPVYWKVLPVAYMATMILDKKPRKYGYPSSQYRLPKKWCFRLRDNDNYLIITPELRQKLDDMFDQFQLWRLHWGDSLEEGLLSNAEWLRRRRLKRNRPCDFSQAPHCFESHSLSW